MDVRIKVDPGVFYFRPIRKRIKKANSPWDEVACKCINTQSIYCL